MDVSRFFAGSENEFLESAEAWWNLNGFMSSGKIEVISLRQGGDSIAI